MVLRITFAVAGFRLEELDVTVEDGQLIVCGKPSDDHSKDRERVRRVGIASKTDASKTETCN